MTYTTAPRWSSREKLDVDFHLRLIDDDLDRQDERADAIEARYASIQRTLYALVVAVALAALSLTANVVALKL